MTTDTETKIRVITNNQPRLLVNWDQLTDKEQEDFDYLLTDDEKFGADFVRYRGRVYDLGEFQVPPPELRKEWDGFTNDSYFSGVVFRYQRENTYTDYDHVVMATWMV